MGNAVVKTEIDKLVAEYGEGKSKTNALACAWIIANYKGINIKAFDVSKTSSLCDYNIMATATNTTQAQTMIDEIKENLKRHGSVVVSLEGMDSGEWILLDLGDVIVHIFQDFSRDVFNLDELWKDQEQLDIPQEFYFSRDLGNNKETAEEGYF